MKASLALLSEPRVTESGRPGLSVLLAYQDVACGRRAQSALDRGLAQLPAPRCCRLDLWSFAMLEHPLLQEEVDESAALAAVIVLSILGDGPPPPKVRSWLVRWLNRRTEPKRTLAVLVAGPQRHVPALFETVLDLDRASQSGGAEFLLGFEEADGIVERALVAAWRRHRQQDAHSHPQDHERTQA